MSSGGLGGCKLYFQKHDSICRRKFPDQHFLQNDDLSTFQLLQAMFTLAYKTVPVPFLLL